MSKAFVGIALALCAAALTARGLAALSTADPLDWDETYYASITSTAANGLGVYPYVMGYPSIPRMGGIGNAVWLYALAYKVAGPHVIALRVVSFLASLLAVAGLAVLTKRLYGSAAGIAALASTPALPLFERTNTIRLDVFATAFVAWALILYLYVREKQRPIGWHVLLGFTFALGLEVHPHTAAAAFAVGFAYLVEAIAALWRDRIQIGVRIKPLAVFAGGYLAGVALFLAVNALPNPEGFFRTAALARLSAVDSPDGLNLTASMDGRKFVSSFLSPTIIVPKEIARYRSIVAAMRWWEILLWLAALTAFIAVRPEPRGLPIRALLVGAVIGGGIVFNGASPLYFSAILPFFIPALATFVTHGAGSRTQVNLPDISRASVALLLLLALAILPSVLARAWQAGERIREYQGILQPPALIDQVRSTASPECILAGPTDLYTRYFMKYPKFVGTRDVEVLIGTTYYGLQDNRVAYWHQKQPDVVFGTADDDLRAFLGEAKYLRISDGVWQKPGNLSPNCTITAR